MPKTWARSRALVAVIGVIVAMVAFAGTASAAPYTDQPTVAVDNESPVAGSHIRVCGTGFHAHSKVVITLGNHRRLSSVRTDKSGSYCKTVKLPKGVHGIKKIVSKDRRGAKASVSIHITKKKHHKKDRDSASLKGSSTAGTSSSTAGTTGTAIKVARVSFNGTSASASDSAAVIGISSIVGMLLFGGGLMLFLGRHRKNLS